MIQQQQHLSWFTGCLLNFVHVHYFIWKYVCAQPSMLKSLSGLLKAPPPANATDGVRLKAEAATVCATRRIPAGRKRKGEHCPDHNRHTSSGCCAARNLPWHFRFEAWTEKIRSSKCQRGKKKKTCCNLYPAVWKHTVMRQHWISSACKSATIALLHYCWAATLVQRSNASKLKFTRYATSLANFNTM